VIRPLLPAAAIALLALLQGPAAGEEGPPPALPKDQVLAREFLEAFRSGDQAAMAALAAKSAKWEHLDPFLVAYDLLGLHGEGILRDPPGGGEALDAAGAFSDLVKGERGNGSLPSIVQGWRLLGTEEVRREAALHGLLRRIHSARLPRATGEWDALLEEARKSLATAPPGVGAALLRKGVGGLLVEAGRTRESVPAWREAAAAAALVPWPAGQGICLWAAGYQSYRCGDLGASRALWEEELAVFEAMGDRARFAQVLVNMAEAYEALGEYGAALELAERALREAEAAGDRWVAAQALEDAASLQVLRGDYARGLPRLEEARRRYLTECSSILGGGTSLAATGRTYARLGIHGRAVEALERAVSEIDSLRVYGTVAARIRGELGTVYAEAGHPDRAEEIQERAWRDLVEAGERPDAADALARLGTLRARQGSLDRAAEALQQALAEMEAMGNRAAAARARAELGRVCAARGEVRLATDLGERALEEMEAVGDRAGASGVLLDLARLQRRSGRPAEALRLARRAVETPLLLGIGLGEEEGEGLRRDARAAADAGFLAAKDLLDRPPPEGADAAGEAFWFAEASRGLLLAEGIVNRDSLLAAAVPAALREEDAAARERVAALRNTLADLASRAGAEPGTVLAARADLDAAYRGLEVTSARVQREARSVAGLVYPRPVALADLQAGLDPGTVLAIYHLTPERSFAVAVTRDSARLVDLGDAADLAAAAEAYLEVVSVEGSADGRKAAALYESLLRPLEEETAGRTRILVSPDGPLAFLPFEALLREEGGLRQRVLERWEVSYVPSATVLHLLRDGQAREGGPGRGLLAVGDPLYPGEGTAPETGVRGRGTLRRLPGTAAEVEAIGGLVPAEDRHLLLREKGTAAGLAGALARHPGRLAALHIACHGSVDAVRPRLTGLVLTGGEVLTVDAVYRMRVPADLVVLSACDTGLGRILRGEGALGLARAFLFAGASRVVASDWAVSDEATRALMVAFYRGMLRDGLSAPEALRAAKLQALRAGGPASHPAHWAAFVLWGD